MSYGQLNIQKLYKALLIIIYKMLNKIYNYCDNHTTDIVSKINFSEFTEYNLKDMNKEMFSDLSDCIISCCEPMYQTLSNSEKKGYFSRRKLEIATEIDESSIYSDCKFSKSFSKRMIQNGFTENSMLSVFHFLSEYYRVKIFLVVDNMYVSSYKNFKDEVFIVYKGDKWYECETNISDLVNDQSCLTNTSVNMDCNWHIYDPIKHGLFPLSKYKMNDLTNLATKNNIDVYKDGKKKIKKVLYDDIYIFLINNYE